MERSVMSDLSNEMWLAERLKDHRGPDIFSGDTNHTIRKQRLRQAINSCGLEAVVIGSKKGKPISWREAFESFYGEAL